MNLIDYLRKESGEIGKSKNEISEPDYTTHLFLQIRRRIKNVFYSALSVILFSCAQMATFPDRLQLYAETFSQPAKLITNDEGVIHYNVKYNRSTKAEDDSLLAKLTKLRGLTIQKCLLPTQKEKYKNVCFTYQFDDRDINQEFTFFTDTTAFAWSIDQRTQTFYGSINARCSTYVDDKSIQFDIYYSDSFKMRQMGKQSLRCAQFIRFYILADSSSNFFMMGFDHHRKGWSDIPQIYLMNDKSLYIY